MDEQFDYQPNTPVDITANIIAAYVSRNHVQVSEMPALIASVHSTLSDLRNSAVAKPAGPEKATAAQIRKSITHDALISFVDGKPYKTLKRHLTGNGLTIEEYRVRYGLPSDYPSTAPSYSAQRSEMAKSLGLGQIRKKAAPMTDAAAETVFEAPKPRGRPRKAVEAAETAPKARGRKKVAETA